MRHFVFFLGFILLTTACNTSPNYQDKLSQELQSGKKNNALFLDFTFDTKKDEFYEICWKLNREKKARPGSSNASVAIDVPEGSLNHPAVMEFYPEFYKDKIAEMLVEYKYKGWAPWNKELQAEHLIKDVFQLLKKQYGDFFLADLGKKGKVLCNINGNRRIIIRHTNDASRVQVVFNDMSVYEAATAAKNERRANAPNQRVPAWATPGAKKK